MSPIISSKFSGTSSTRRKIPAAAETPIKFVDTDHIILDAPITISLALAYRAHTRSKFRQSPRQAGRRLPNFSRHQEQAQYRRRQPPNRRGTRPIQTEKFDLH
jgi:hypothetical protein